MGFANWLREEMHSRNINQPQLAEALGVTQPTISRWLNGKLPDPEQSTRLCEYFDINLSFLYQLMGRLERPEGFSPEMTVRVERIENLLSSINDDRVKEIVIAKLDSSFAETVDLIERIQDLLDDETTPPD